VNPDERSVLRAQKAIAAVLRPFARVDVGPRPDVPPGPVILAANHRSMADLLLASGTFARWEWPIRPLVAASYFDRPGLGTILRRLRCIPVTGTDALALAADALAAGWSVAIMPEGRIVRAEEWAETGVGRPHPGVGRLAIDTGLPVVANGAVGTEDFWPRERSLPRLRPWSRPHLVLRSEVLGVINEPHSRDAMETIWDGVRRCVERAGAERQA